MSSWYLYYRLLWTLRYGRHSDFVNGISTARTELQDVLGDLRDKAAKELEWSDQQTQDFFESLVTKFRYVVFPEDAVMRHIQDERDRLEQYA